MNNTTFYILTYNEKLSGVFNSQVFDVADFIKKQFAVNTKVICMVPIQNYFKLRKEFKTQDPTCVVIPSIPKINNWKKNASTVSLFIKESNAVIMGRNPIATNIALELKKKNKINKVVFDARGAFAAEFLEYHTLNNELQALSFKLEAEALLKSDSINCVSEKLLLYFKKNYKVGSALNYVIPTTLSSTFNNIKSEQEVIYFNSKDILIAFCGSNADWQSFKLIDNYLLKQFEFQNNVKALIISNTNIDNWNCKKLFNSRIKQIEVAHKDVIKTLSTCDYGILLREKTITNSVAAPTKFAEYLLAGLPIICSAHIGDYSEFVVNKNVGFIENQDRVRLIKNTDKERKRISNIAIEYFSKEKNKVNFRDLLRSVDLL